VFDYYEYVHQGWIVSHIEDFKIISFVISINLGLKEADCNILFFIEGLVTLFLAL